MLNSQDNSKLYVITRNCLLVFDYNDSLKFKNCIYFDELYRNYGMDGTTIRAIGYYKNWGNIIGSTNRGFNISYDEPDYFKPLNIPDLKEFNFLGTLEDSISFWWNAADSKMRLIENNGRVKDYVYGNISKLKSINYIANDTFFIAGSNDYFFTFYNKKLINAEEAGFGSGLSAIRDKDGIFYEIESSGFFGIKINNKHIYTTIDRDKYSGLIYDSFQKQFIAYNQSKIFIHKKKKIL